MSRVDRRGAPADPSIVVFDLGHVVCDFRPDRRRRELAGLTGRSEDVVEARLFSGTFGDDLDEGRYTLDEALALVALALDYRGATHHLREAWNTAFAPDTAVLGVVEAVRRLIPTALFTNNGPFVAAGMADELASVATPFDHLFFSCEIGTRKPDPAAFRAVAQALDAEPERLHLVDDSERNVEVARSVGWGGTVFTDVAALTAELEARSWV